MRGPRRASGISMADVLAPRGRGNSCMSDLHPPHVRHRCRVRAPRRSHPRMWCRRTCSRRWRVHCAGSTRACRGFPEPRRGPLGGQRMADEGRAACRSAPLYPPRWMRVFPGFYRQVAAKYARRLGGRSCAHGGRPASCPLNWCRRGALIAQTSFDAELRQHRCWVGSRDHGHTGRTVGSCRAIGRKRCTCRGVSCSRRGARAAARPFHHHRG